MQDLFDFLAMTLKNFVERNNDGFEQSDKRKELGLTFPFPVRQLSVSSGILIKWTKGFAIRDTVSSCLLADLFHFLVGKYEWGKHDFYYA